MSDERSGFAVDGLTLDVSESGGGRLRILDISRFAIDPGQSVALTGPSGAGKTSLLHCLAGITRPTSGRVLWAGADIVALRDRERDAWRREQVGMIFQDFHLVPELGILDNILLPSSFTRWRPTREARHRASQLADAFGLADPGRRAALLSRGEQQRVAVARAVLARPAIILADEPTASLDRDNAATIAGLLIETARESGACLVVATHDTDLIARLDRNVRLVGGRPAATDLGRAPIVERVRA